MGKCEGPTSLGTRLVVFPRLVLDPVHCNKPKSTTSRTPTPLRAGTPFRPGPSSGLLHLFGNPFSRALRASPGYPSKIPGISRQKSLISLASRDIPNFLAPTPSDSWKTPTRPQKYDIWTQKFGSVLLFACNTFLSEKTHF